MTRASSGFPDDTDDDLDTPMVVVVGRVWLVLGGIAVLAAVLLRSGTVAVFGIVCLLAGGAFLIAQLTRVRLAGEERQYRPEPGGAPPTATHGATAGDDAGGGADGSGGGDHRTRVMTPDGEDEARPEDRDDVVDVEWYDYVAPADQDDGTGYDDEVNPEPAWFDEPTEEHRATGSDDEDAERPSGPEDAADRGSSSTGGSSSDGTTGTGESGAHDGPGGGSGR